MVVVIVRRDNGVQLFDPLLLQKTDHERGTLAPAAVDQERVAVRLKQHRGSLPDVEQLNLKRSAVGILRLGRCTVCVLKPARHAVAVGALGRP